MPTPITANSVQMNKVVNIPLDGIDNVDTNSVSPAYQSILNNTFYLARTQVYQRPHITIGSQDNTNVIIYSYKGLWCSITGIENWKSFESNTQITLTAANLDTGMAFTNSTTYYIYFTGIVNSFEISTTPPDLTGTFKLVAGIEQFNRRYVGSFLTDALNAIMHFRMVDFEYRFVGPTGLTNFSGTNLTGTTFVDVTFTGIPVPCHMVTLYVRLTNSAAVAGDELFTYAPKGSEAHASIDLLSTKGGTALVIAPAIVNYTSKIMSAKTNTSTDVVARIWWIGYKE